MSGDNPDLYDFFIYYPRQTISNVYADLAILAATRDPSRAIAWLLRSRSAASPARPRRCASYDGRLVMLDAVMLAIGGVFLVLAVLYTLACDRI